MTTALTLPENHPARTAAEAAGVSPTLVVLRSQGWAKVHEEGRCRMCLRPPSVRALTRHHIVPQSFFGDRPELAPIRHTDANIVGLCDPCHRAVEERGAHARIELRRLLGAAEVAFVIQLRGRDWLDQRYPATGSRPRAIAPPCGVVIERSVYASRRMSEARRL